MIKLYVVSFIEDGKVVVDSVFTKKAFAHERCRILATQSIFQDLSCQAVDVHMELTIET